MSKKLSTHYSDDNKGYAEVYYDFREELAYIKYFDNNNKVFYTEEFPNNSIRYVEDAAENWALGIKKLEENNILLNE